MVFRGILLFPWYFDFSPRILTFLGEKWRFFTFSKGKCKIPRNFEFSEEKVEVFYFFQRENAKYRGKSEGFDLRTAHSAPSSVRCTTGVLNSSHLSNNARVLSVK